ncbi:MAG: GAF domain-containing protein [Halobacteria archaeon]
MSGEDSRYKVERHLLFDIMNEDAEFHDKAQRALELGQSYLGAEKAHVAQIDEEASRWEAIVSTEGENGMFPEGMVLDLDMTYCKRVVDEERSIALHDAPNQGWSDEPAYLENQLNCYHGVPIILDDGVFGTVCFVSPDRRKKEFDDYETMFAELIARELESELTEMRKDHQRKRLERQIDDLERRIEQPVNEIRELMDSETVDFLETDTSEVTEKEPPEVRGDEAGRAGKTDRSKSDIGKEVKADPVNHIIENLDLFFRNTTTVTIETPSLVEKEPVMVGEVARERWLRCPRNGVSLEIEVNEKYFCNPAITAQLFDNLFQRFVDVAPSHSIVYMEESGEEGFRFEIEHKESESENLENRLNVTGDWLSDTEFRMEDPHDYVIKELTEINGWSLGRSNVDGSVRYEFHVE